MQPPACGLMDGIRHLDTRGHAGGGLRLRAPKHARPWTGDSLKAGGSVAFVLGLLQCARPFVGLLFGFRFRHSVPLLNSPDQLILLAGDSFPVIIGEFTPAARGQSR
jgi:hypothetical protein